MTKWDTKFIKLCKEIATWSKDPSTKHGSIIVDDNNNIVSTGYNGPPRNVDDTLVPTTRPAKYLYYCHSEANAIIAAGRLGRSVENCTIYQTGPSCSYCWLLIANSGIKRQIRGKLSSHCVTEEDLKAQQWMAKQIGIEIVDLDF
jgi:dCMP deaminase